MFGKRTKAWADKLEDASDHDRKIVTWVSGFAIVVLLSLIAAVIFIAKNTDSDEVLASFSSRAAYEREIDSIIENHKVPEEYQTQKISAVGRENWPTYYNTNTFNLFPMFPGDSFVPIYETFRNSCMESYTDSAVGLIFSRFPNASIAGDLFIAGYSPDAPDPTSTKEAAKIQWQDCNFGRRSAPGGLYLFVDNTEASTAYIARVKEFDNPDYSDPIIIKDNLTNHFMGINQDESMNYALFTGSNINQKDYNWVTGVIPYSDSNLVRLKDTLGSKFTLADMAPTGLRPIIWVASVYDTSVGTEKLEKMIKPTQYQDPTQEFRASLFSDPNFNMNNNPFWYQTLTL